MVQSLSSIWVEPICSHKILGSTEYGTEDGSCVQKVQYIHECIDSICQAQNKAEIQALGLVPETDTTESDFDMMLIAPVRLQALMLIKALRYPQRMS